MNDNKSSESTPEQAVVPQQQPMQQSPQVQYVVQEKSLNGIGGWLIFWLIVFGLNALSALWMFFGSLVGLIEGNTSGIGLAILIETVIFSLATVAACTTTTVFMAMSKKLSVLLAYVSLGVSALFTTVVSITAMFSTYPSCSYGGYSYYYPELSSGCTDVHMSVGGIIMLIGAIIVSWLAAFLIALYFKMSKRVALTLVK